MIRAPSGLGIGFDSATIISTSIEGILYGISLVLFGGTLWALIHGRPKDEINWFMALVAFVLSILSTVHLTTDIIRLLEGFVTRKFPGGPAGFFADVTQNTYVIKNVSYVVQTLLGDAIVIYRCHVIWQRFRFILIPVVLWCAAFATSVAFLYDISRVRDPDDPASSLDTGPWVLPFYLLTMLTNLLSSALLAYGVWLTDRNEPGVVRILPRSGIDCAMLLRILIDAAALYAATLFVLVMCYAFHSTGHLIVLDMMLPIISITFYTAVIRIAIARNSNVPDSPPTLSPLHFSARIPSPSDSETMLLADQESE